MIISHYSIIGCLIMLGIGILDFAILRSLLYRPLQHRYEHSKVTGTPGLNPQVIWRWLWIINFLVLPAAGFLLGHTVLGGA